jgi:hypothetical protein
MNMKKKRVIYQVYVGKKSKLYDHCVDSVHEYCKVHGIEHGVQTQPILKIKPDVFATNRSKESYEKHGGYLPIFEKENAFNYLRSNHQVAIIDADIWIRPDAPNIFDEVPDLYDFGAVLEREMPITPQYTQKIANYTRMQYGMNQLQGLFDWKHPGGANFYNMGMMVLNKSFETYLKGQTPMQFLMRPEFKVFIDGMGNWKWSTDQTLLNVWVKESKMSVKNLSFQWNGLFTGIDMNRIGECHFVHFFLKDKLPNGGENVKELMQYVA